jgi:hypothetical protein
MYFPQWLKDRINQSSGTISEADLHSGLNYPTRNQYPYSFKRSYPVETANSIRAFFYHENTAFISTPVYSAAWLLTDDSGCSLNDDPCDHWWHWAYGYYQVLSEWFPDWYQSSEIP